MCNQLNYYFTQKVRKYHLIFPIFESFFSLVLLEWLEKHVKPKIILFLASVSCLHIDEFCNISLSRLPFLSRVKSYSLDEILWKIFSQVMPDINVIRVHSFFIFRFCLFFFIRYFLASSFIHHQSAAFIKKACYDLCNRAFKSN